MSGLLSSLTVQKKLFAPVILLIGLIAVVALMLRSDLSAINETEKSMSNSGKVVEGIYALSEAIEIFTEKKSGFQQLTQEFDALNQAIKAAQPENITELQSDLREIADKAKAMNQQFIDIEALNEQMSTQAENSALQSNTFITNIATRLENPAEAATISELEIKTIVPAMMNTTNNYRVRLLYRRLETNLSLSGELLDYLDSLIAGTARAVEVLRNTPMYKPALMANQSNEKLREISVQFINKMRTLQAQKSDIRQTLNNVIRKAQQQNSAKIEETFDHIGSGFIQILVFLVIAATITTGLSLVFAASIVSPLKQLRERVAQLAAAGGDLTYRIPLDRDDEIGQLAVSINSFIEALQTIFRRVVQCGTQIATASQEAAELARGTQQHMELQQAETTSIASAFNQMEASIQEIARSAAGASETVQQADKKAGAVVETITTTIKMVNGLSKDLEEATQVIQQLDEDSQNIGSILDVIREIADQTNLLALNAAIEAARAGDQGRGFAVVADEVRSLAQRTQSSIEEINGMISNLQDASRRATDVIIKGNEQITATTKHSEKAGEGVTGISQLVSSISSMNLQIASAVEEQSTVIQNINRSIQEIQSLSTAGSESARSANRSSTQQSGHASELIDLVNRFKV